ncbi:amino acid ABC transporter substrate-binding protein [Iodobacter sp. HSC-16F04]|uniref:Amino acid ABC transporter substrate-binding protein n=1 Tax=Iodobacter violaceini TaxID=3044271 RepID=A0ABX0KX84_9NEIS|nr:transporter substrate-binding domain-containing protein [Iodobacter violacea]NHQ86654.1 amino acid ABC transporter substrate-binding protein [Iodobacter violacea]
MNKVKFLGINFLVFLPVAAAQEITLRIGVNQQSSPPYIMGDSLQLQPLPGIAIEQVRAAATHCGIVPDIERYPPLRLLNSLKSNLIQGVLMLSYTGERATFAVYPMRDDLPDHSQRLTTLSYAFFVNQSSKLAWDGKSLTGLKGKVGANMGWSVVKDLERFNIPFEAALSVENNFAKLNAGRIDAYATQQNVGDAFLEQHKKFKIRRLEPDISTKDYFLIFSKSFYAEHPGLATCIWKKIGDERDKLLKKRIPVYLREK